MAKAFKKRPSLVLRLYAVLAKVSLGYSPPIGMFLCVTHPCATLLAPERTFAFDLHVLSTPPAFVLSQDQTLTFKSLAILNNKSLGIENLFFKEAKSSCV